MKQNLCDSVPKRTCCFLPDWSRKSLVWGLFSDKSSCPCLSEINSQKTGTCERSVAGRPT